MIHQIIIDRIKKIIYNQENIDMYRAHLQKIMKDVEMEIVHKDNTIMISEYIEEEDFKEEEETEKKKNIEEDIYAKEFAVDIVAEDIYSKMKKKIKIA